jgi:Xaa-Pro aminopeptidase
MHSPARSATTATAATAALATCAALLAAGCSPAPVQVVWQPAPALAAPAAIAASEYAARRAALAAAMDDGVLLVLGSPQPAADYLPYAQRSNFVYLTGITEPDAALLIEKRGGQLEERLFVLPRDPARETWEGRRLGAAGATALTGIPAATRGEFLADLGARLPRADRLYTLGTAPVAPGPGRFLGPEVQLVNALVAQHTQLSVTDLSPVITHLRAHKSAAEIDLLRRAIHITVLAHREAARALQPGMNEFEIQALVEYTFRRHGADEPGFSSIIGSGPNSTTLHYRAADRFMQAGEVLLIDIGASYRGYTADVTRTYPVTGRWSPRQLEIYRIVLDAQKAAEAAVRPGATWADLNAAAEAVMAERLAGLGLVDAPDATYLCESPRFGTVCPQYRLYYMHGLGHGIGLDVHDPDPSHLGAFAVGSIFTIEPGIYIRADAFDHLPDTPENRAMAERLRPVHQQYIDIGVRIEDDYLLQADGLVRLTEGAPREPEAIEALMREPGRIGAPRQPEIVDWYRQTERRP